jgi:hypothetical protein
MSRHPLERGAGREKGGGAEDVPIGEAESAEAFVAKHFGRGGGAVEAEEKRVAFFGLGEVDPNDAGGVVGTGGDELLARQHGRCGTRSGVGIDIEGSGFFLPDDAGFLDCGEAGARDGVEDFPLAAAAQTRPGAGEWHDGDEFLVFGDFEDGEVADDGGDGGIGRRLDVAGGDFFDCEGGDIGDAENGAGGRMRGEAGVELAEESLVAVEALGDEFPWGAVGEKRGGDEFVVGGRRRGSGLGRGFRADEWCGGSFRRGDEMKIFDAEGVVREWLGGECAGAFDHGGMVERFAAGGLVKVEGSAKDGVGGVGDGAGGEALIVEENAEEEDFVDGTGRGCGGLAGGFSGGASEGEAFLGTRDAKMLADLEEVALEVVEFFELSDGDVEAARDTNEDIAFFDGVEGFVEGRWRAWSGGLGGINEDGDFLRGQAPGLGGDGGDDPPFPIHGALEAGLGAGLVGVDGEAEEEEEEEGF